MWYGDVACRHVRISVACGNLMATNNVAMPPVGKGLSNSPVAMAAGEDKARYK
jgi:hypothetical protein